MNKNVASPVADIELKMHQNRIAVGAPAGIPYRGTYTALSQAPNYRKRKEMERGGMGKKKRNKREGKKEMKGEDEKEGSRGVIPLVSFQSNRWFAVGLV